MDFIPRESIWKTIEDIVKEEEKLEIKKVLGESLVDETLDLHREVDMLLEIWKDLCVTAGQNDSIKSLPEPPSMRMNLEKQISLLVDLLHQKAAREGRAVGDIITTDDAELVENIFNGGKERSTCSHSSTRDTMSSGYESRSSSSLSVDLGMLEENVNIMQFDDLADQLRNDLEDERDGLFSDINFVQNAMIEEKHEQDDLMEMKKNAPSLSDLRSLSNKLESQVLKDDFVSIHPTLLPNKEDHEQSIPPDVNNNHSKTATNYYCTKKNEVSPNTVKSSSRRSTPSKSPHHTPTPSSPARPTVKLKKHSTDNSPKVDKSKKHALSTKTLLLDVDMDSTTVTHPTRPSLTEHGFIKRSGSVSSNGSSISPDITDRLLEKRLTPSPPSSSKSSSSSRSSSASVNRFRNLVVSYRDESVT